MEREVRDAQCKLIGYLSPAGEDGRPAYVRGPASVDDGSPTYSVIAIQQKLYHEQGRGRWWCFAPDAEQIAMLPQVRGFRPA